MSFTSEKNGGEQNSEKRDCQEDFHTNLLRDATGHNGRMQMTDQKIIHMFLILTMYLYFGAKEFWEEKSKSCIVKPIAVSWRDETAV